MWTLHYSQEAKFYFLDNDPYCFDLLVKIEELKFSPDGIPVEGLTPLEHPDEPDLYLWLVLNQVVILRKLTTERGLYIIVVRPLE